jgi:hypothetical protein
MPFSAGRNLTAMGALGYFQMRVQEIVEKHGKSAMFWDEFWVSQVGAAQRSSSAVQRPLPIESQLLTSAADLTISIVLGLLSLSIVY